ncbi:mechanosensitive ion channel family protein [Candidatus Micrarchaeota archaeon]|nr:mechanosensitive ion channel family protein [Candidatus Micrarchaeota archaeon]
MALSFEGFAGRVQQFASGFDAVSVVYAAAVFLVSYIVLKSALFVLNKVLRKMSERTKNTLDDSLFNAVQKPLNFLAVLLSVFFAFSFAFPSLQALGKSLNELFLVAFILWAAFSLNRVVSAFIGWYGLELGSKSESKFGKQVFPFIKKTAWLAVYGSAALIVLDFFGVQIAPLLAGLGIAGLAVALALQESLANFFAGVYILADRPIRPGDFIELENGKSGNVEEIGWRSTCIHTLSNDTVIIPNAKLAQSVIVNYNLPSRKSSISVKVGVAYDSNVDLVEKVLLECAGVVSRDVAGCVKDFQPLVRLSNFSDSALEFSIVLQVEDIAVQSVVSDALRREVLKSFKKHKIGIPFPTRVVYTKK